MTPIPSWRRTATLVLAATTMLAFTGCRGNHTTIVEPVRQEPVAVPVPVPEHHDDHHDDHRPPPPPPPDRRDGRR